MKLFFFNLLNLHHGIVQSVYGNTHKINGITIDYSGRDFFFKVADALAKKYNASIDKEKALEDIKIYLRNNGHVFSHYTNNIIVIITLVEEKPNPAQYLKIIEAQLSISEKIILGYLAEILDTDSILKEKTY